MSALSVKARLSVLLSFFALTLACVLGTGCANDDTPDSVSAEQSPPATPMSRPQIATQMAQLMGSDAAPMPMGPVNQEAPMGVVRTQDLRPLGDGGDGGSDGGYGGMGGGGGGNTGSGYCGGYKLCQTTGAAAAECADQPEGQKDCCPCPACNKHCYSCGTGGGGGGGGPAPVQTCKTVINPATNQPGVECGSINVPDPSVDGGVTTLQCGTCPSGKACVGGKCAFCKPKECSYYPGQCGELPSGCPTALIATGGNEGTINCNCQQTTAVADAGADSGDAGDAGAPLVCNIIGKDQEGRMRGVCETPQCTASNIPTMPTGAPVDKTTIWGAHIPKFLAGLICTALVALQVPLTMPDDVIGFDVVTSNKANQVNEPVCKLTSQSSGGTGINVQLCSWLIKFSTVDKFKSIEEHCPYCDPGASPPSSSTNKCTSTWAHQQTVTSSTTALRVGVQWTVKLSKYLQKIPLNWAYFDWLKAWVGRNLASIGDCIDTLVSGKLHFLVGGEGTNETTIETRGPGTDPKCPGTGQNCETKVNRLGPTFTGGGSLKAAFPGNEKKITDTACFGAGYIANFFSVFIKASFDITGSIGYQSTEKHGECGDLSCEGAYAFIRVSANIDWGISIFGMWPPFINRDHGGRLIGGSCTLEGSWQQCTGMGTVPYPYKFKCSGGLDNVDSLLTE